jgi:hypothetical protein
VRDTSATRLRDTSATHTLACAPHEVTGRHTLLSLPLPLSCLDRQLKGPAPLGRGILPLGGTSPTAGCQRRSLSRSHQQSRRPATRWWLRPLHLWQRASTIASNVSTLVAWWSSMELLRSIAATGASFSGELLEQQAAGSTATSLHAGPSGPGAVAVLRARGGVRAQLLSCWKVPQSCAREPSTMAVY